MFIYNGVKGFERTVNSFIKGYAMGLDVFEGPGKASLKKIPFYLSFEG
jgi:hypothetical protein